MNKSGAVNFVSKLVQIVLILCGLIMMSAARHFLDLESAILIYITGIVPTHFLITKKGQRDDFLIYMESSSSFKLVFWPLYLFFIVIPDAGAQKVRSLID